MKIQGEHVLAAPRSAVWEALLDPEVLRRTLPGFDALDKVGDNAYEGALQLRVGPVQGRFQGRLELTALDPPAGYHMKMSGKGAPGFVDGEGDIRLTEEGDATRLHYALDAQIGGRIAGVGQRLLDSSAKVLTRQALEGLDRQIAARSAPGPAAAAAHGAPAAGAPGSAGTATPDAPEPPSQLAFAVRMAGGVLADLVPPRRRPLAFAIALALYTVAVVLLTRACS